MPSVEVSKKIVGNIDSIYQIVKNMEDYPRFMKDLISVDTLERSEKMTITHWISNVDGRKIQWTEEDYFFDEQKRIEYKQIEGDLKRFAGYWQLTPDDEGVMITLFVDFEFGIPMISALLNPLLKRKVRENSENMLEAIRKQVEPIS